jgi:peroxiredoxin
MKIFNRLILSLIGLVLVTSSSFKTKDSGYNVGDTVADFKLKGVSGDMVSLSDAKYADAKGYLVVFSCNHCPYVVAYEDRIIALHEKFGKDYPVVAINPNVATHEEDSYEMMKKRVSDKGFKFDYLVDEDQSIAQTFGATRTPHVYLLKKENGQIKVAYIGAIDNNAKDASQANEKYVEDAIKALQNGQSIPQERQVTKAIGCTIKWKS